MKVNRDIAALCQPFQSFFRSFLIECQDNEIFLLVTETKRTTERQQELYAQGRTKPGNIVTWLDGINEKSKHQDGQAADIAFDPAFHGSLYHSDMTLWNKVYDIAENNDISSLYRKYGVDKCHLEYTDSIDYTNEDLLFNYYIMQLPTEILDAIKQDYEPMTIEEMYTRADEWDVKEEFERGLTKLSQPKNNKDFRLCIVLGRIKIA